MRHGRTLRSVLAYAKYTILSFITNFTVAKVGPTSYFIAFMGTALHACKCGTPHIAHNIVAYLFGRRDALFIKPWIVSNDLK